MPPFTLLSVDYYSLQHADQFVKCFGKYYCKKIITIRGPLQQRVPYQRNVLSSNRGTGKRISLQVRRYKDVFFCILSDVIRIPANRS